MLMGMPWRRPVAGPPPVTDIDLTSLAGRWRPSRPASVWSDNGITQAVTGGTIYRVDDEVGGAHLIQASAGARPTLAADRSIARHQGILFASSKYLMTAGNISTLDTTYYWVGAFDRNFDAIAFCRTDGSSLPFEYLYYASSSDGNASDTLTAARGLSQNARPAAGALPTKKVGVVAVVVKSGTNAKIYVDGTLVATSPGSPGLVALAAKLALNTYIPGAGSYTGPSTCLELDLYSVAHDATAVAANSAILLTKYNALTAVPSDFASLMLDLRLGAADLYTDAARTTAAASGDPVGGWKDTSAAAHHLSQTLSGRRPIFYSSGLGGGSRPRVSFDGSDDGLLVSGWGLGSGPQTLAMELVRRTNVPTSQRLFSVRVAGPVFSAISLINFPGYNEVTCYFGGEGSASVGCNPTLGVGRHTLVVCYNGLGPSTPGNYAMFVDGVSKDVTSGGFFPDSTAMGAFGSYSDATLPSSVDVGRTVAWSADHRGSLAVIEGWLNG